MATTPTPVTVADVMTRDVVAVTPETSLETAARLMAQHHISGVPVVAQTGELEGVITLSDLVDPDRDESETKGYSVFFEISQGAAWLEDLNIATVEGCVSEVMTPMVLTIDPGASIEEAARKLLRCGIHRLLVTENGVLAGVVSSTDLLRGFILGEPLEVVNSATA